MRPGYLALSRLLIIAVAKVGGWLLQFTDVGDRMNRRIRILAALRKRRAGILRAVLPLLTAVWFNAAASLCFAMTADDSPGHAAPSGHQHAPAEHTPDHRCPHCPPSNDRNDAPGAHLNCSGLDEISTGSAASKALQWELKHALPTEGFDSSSAVIRQTTAYRAANSAIPRHSTVPLNVRHCVFLL